MECTGVSWLRGVVIAGSGPPAFRFLFQELLSQLSIPHLRKDVPAWATDCQGNNKPAKEVTSQFKTRKKSLRTGGGKSTQLHPGVSFPILGKNKEFC